MRLSRRIVLILAGVVLAAVFVVLGLKWSGSIKVSNNIIYSSILLILAIIILNGSALTEALRVSSQVDADKAKGSESSDILASAAGRRYETLRMLAGLSSDNAVARIVALNELMDQDQVTDEMASVFRDILAVLIRQTATRDETSPYRRVELERAISSWASMAKNRRPISRPLDLSGLNLDHLRLRYLHLAGVNLADASLVEADITGSDLSGADFSNANLERCNATDAQFKLALFSDTNLANAILTGADMSGAMVRHSNLSRVSARSVNFHRAALANVDLDHADLSSTNLNRAMLVSSNSSGISLEGASLVGAAISKDLDIPIQDYQDLPNVSWVRDEADLEYWLRRRLGGSAISSRDPR